MLAEDVQHRTPFLGMPSCQVFGHCLGSVQLAACSCAIVIANTLFCCLQHASNQLAEDLQQCCCLWPWCLLPACHHLQAKRGKHSSKEVSVPRINDVSAPGQGARAKQYLPFLQRGGKLMGLVESVSSGECKCMYSLAHAAALRCAEMWFLLAVRQHC